jgi:signal transduction histidine kinase
MDNTFADDLAAIAKIDAVPHILEVLCRTTGMGFSAVARVTEDRWICCAARDEISFGLRPGGELKVETTICDEIRDSGRLVVIDHVAEDEDFRNHPTPKLYGFQSYISVPIYKLDGQFFGTLCAIDPKPARLKTPETIGMFKLFSDLIARHLDALERLAAGEQALLVERQNAELREQFIAVLGHDLRNPLTAILGSARLLLKNPQSEKAIQLTTMIQDGAMRMDELIDNVLDFARSRLGEGLSLTLIVDEGLETTLEQVIAELKAGWPDRVIHGDIELSRPVTCERARIAQLFSNLLANAIIHGDSTSPVRVRARSDGGGFTLSVINRGDPIPSDAMGGLFQPFSRASTRPGRQGLGLGLYIASEIARAHEGSLEVVSTAEETCFTFRIPLPGAEEPNNWAEQDIGAPIG